MPIGLQASYISSWVRRAWASRSLDLLALDGLIGGGPAFLGMVVGT